LFACPNRLGTFIQLKQKQFMMKRKNLIIAVLILMVNMTHSQNIKEPEQPNILFLSINDVNDFVGFLDGRYKAITPNMDEIASRGVNFTNAHCTTPSCGPSRNALLFGQYSFNSGLYRYNQEMQEVQKEIRKKTPEFISLPQMLGHIHTWMEKLNGPNIICQIRKR